jgi:nitroimidazol reductase NimA-like FMN-containing flavoprotein (pyridoxamine 5'-phosphate oxidase superfamily)
MVIHEMTEHECRRALRRATFGKLACARDNQPYVVPIHFWYDGKHVYGFTTLGQKVEWMRSNPLVCLEIDERRSDNEWMSVIVFGRYEELPDTPEFGPARAQARHLLRKRAIWWEPAFAAAEHRDKPHVLAPVFYRIHIEQMTGHRATA